MTVVDVHCHAFNADDLPVRGFVRRVHASDVALGGALAALVDAVIQGSAPGYRADLARLDTLLTDSAVPEETALTRGADRDRFEADVDRAVAELREQDPELLARAGAALAAEEQGPGGAEGLSDVWSAARRAIRWVKLFGRSRLDLVADLVSDFDGVPDLVTPLLVDLGTGLEDRAETTGRQQVELFEKISRAAMLGRLPGIGRTQVHPFVGFDPLRELHARRTREIETPLDLVRLAVLDYGFVGVKVYPPMGWRPSGNQPRPGLSAEDARELDRIVDDLAGWCAEEDVPIIAHGADTVHAAPGFAGFGSPAHWRPVLAAHPELHVDLGHFGGRGGAWPREIARAMTDLPGLYADVGNNGLHDARAADEYFALLADLFADPATEVLAERLMYGSDWYMVAIQPDHRRFLDEYRRRFGAAFGDAVTRRFLGGNALTFLGFDDPANRNNRRLRARYERYGQGALPPWLATGGTEAVLRPGKTRTATMTALTTVSNRPPFEELATSPVKSRSTQGDSGSATDEESRTLRYLAVAGKAGPLRPPFESVIGLDERVRVLDTDLAPWRMICALRMRGANGGTAIGTGWFIGPRTVLTAGHCVYSTRFFGGWAETIEVIPGLNGSGRDDAARPYGSVMSRRFSSVERWTTEENADFDIGCIHLDEPLGEKVGWFAVGVLPDAELVSYLVNISGYPADRGMGTEQYHAVNRVLQVSDRRVFYEVDTYGGQSGAPVWIHEEPSAPPLAVAVHAYGTGGTPADLGVTANSAPRIIPEVFDTLVEWIEQDDGQG